MYGMDGRRSHRNDEREDLSAYAGARPVRVAGNGEVDQREIRHDILANGLTDHGVLRQRFHNRRARRLTTTESAPPSTR